MQHHKYSLTELENMMPWERDVYVNLLIRYLREEEARQKQAQGTQTNLQMAALKIRSFLPAKTTGDIRTDPAAAMTTSINRLGFVVEDIGHIIAKMHMDLSLIHI